MLIRIHFDNSEISVNFPDKNYSEPLVDDLLDKLRMRLEKIKEEQQTLFEQVAMVEIEESIKGFEAHLYFLEHESGSLVILL
jgi:hypothetical protein